MSPLSTDSGLYFLGCLCQYLVWRRLLCSSGKSDVIDDKRVGFVREILLFSKNVYSLTLCYNNIRQIMFSKLLFAIVLSCL